MTVKLRRDIGRPLTYDEMDDNFAHLDSASSSALDPSEIETYVDSAYINARVDHPENLSEFVNDVGFISTADDIDATTMGGIGKDSSYYLDYTHFTNTPTIPVDNTELTNGAGYLDSVGVADYITSIGGLDSNAGGGGGTLDSASLSQFSIAVLGDVNISSIQNEDFLQWNGTQWVNTQFHIEASLEFHGVTDLTNDTAPLAPANGDLYVNNTSGTVGASWTGIAGQTASEGAQVIWSVDDSRWYLIGNSSGGIGGGGVTDVSGGTGISVDNTNPAHPSVSIDKSVTDTWYPDAGTTVSTTGNQTIGGTKTFSNTIQGNISGSASSASTANSASVADKVVHPLTLNGTAYDGSSSKSLTFSTSDTVTRIRSGSSSYLTGNITLQGSGDTTVSQSGSTITISSTGGGGGTAGPPGTDGKGWTGGSYNAGNGKVTFSSNDGLGFSTGDLRGAQGIQGLQGPPGPSGSSSDTLQDVTARGATTTRSITAPNFYCATDGYTLGGTASGGARIIVSNGMTFTDTNSVQMVKFNTGGSITASGSITANGNITATKFVTSGSSSSYVVLGDGSTALVSSLGGTGSSSDTLQDVTDRGATTTKNITANTYFTADNTWTLGKSAGARIFCSNGTIAFKNSSGTNSLQITSAGTITATADVVAYSDEKLKENVNTAPTGVIEQLRGVTFDWKKTGIGSAGLIAQELKEVLPHLVTETTFDDEEETTLAVNYLGLIPYLIEEVKSLRKELEELK